MNYYKPMWIYFMHTIQKKNTSNLLRVNKKVTIEKAKFNYMYIHWNSIYISTSPKIWLRKGKPLNNIVTR